MSKDQRQLVSCIWEQPHNFLFPNPQTYPLYNPSHIFDSEHLSNNQASRNIYWYRSMLYCLHKQWFLLDTRVSISLYSQSSLWGIALRTCCLKIMQTYHWGMSLSNSMLSCLRNIRLESRGNCMCTTLLWYRGIVCDCNSSRTEMSNGHPMYCILLLGITLHSFEIRHRQSSKIHPQFDTFLHIFLWVGYLDA